MSHTHSGENPVEHRRGLLPEKFFRWRAGEITRLEAFCDVVFGFALTLQQNIIMATIGVISFLLAFRYPNWAGFWFFTIGPALGIHGAINGKKVRALAQKLHMSG